MDKRYVNLAEMYRDASMNNLNARRTTAAAQIPVPSCVNDNFCNSAPQDKNDGILTMVFIDMQPLDSVYSPEASLCNGTLFPNINKPFSGGMVR